MYGVESTDSIEFIFQHEVPSQEKITYSGFVCDYRPLKPETNIHLHKSKTWDMRYYWLKDRETQKQINIYWKKGKDVNDPNLADYATKYHSIIHHRGVRHLYVLDQLTNHIHSLNLASQALRGCVSPPRIGIPSGTKFQSCDVTFSHSTSR